MRHKLGYRKLNRTTEHRKALFMNMLNSLIKYEQITTTLPKAKELKPKIDKVITLGKKNNLQSKKNLFSRLHDKLSVDKLSKTLSQRYEKRKGGYSRVIRSGFLGSADDFSDSFVFFLTSTFFALRSRSTNSITAIGASSPYLNPALTTLQ